MLHVLVEVVYRPNSSAMVAIVVHVQRVIITYTVYIGIIASKCTFFCMSSSDSNKKVSTGVVSGVVIAQTSARVSVEPRVRQLGVRYARRASK